MGSSASFAGNDSTYSTERLTARRESLTAKVTYQFQSGSRLMSAVEPFVVHMVDKLEVGMGVSR